MKRLVQRPDQKAFVSFKIFIALKDYYPVKFIILFLAYYLTARFGLTFEPVSGFATFIWPPTGISLAILLLYGYSLWPAIFLGAFLVNISVGASIPLGIGIAIGNSLEAVVGVYLLTKLIKFRPSLDRLEDALGLIIFGAFLSTVVSATIGVYSLFLLGMINSQALVETWLAWWIGDMLGNLIIAPLILVWNKPGKFLTIRSKLFEGILASSLFIFCILILFTNILGFENKIQPLSHIIFPPLIWFALRFSQRTALTAIFITTFIAVMGTFNGVGPFVRESLLDRLLRLQSYMGVLAATVLIVSTIIKERDQLEERKDEFIALAAHELKTPITTIYGIHQLLLSKINDPEVTKQLSLSYKEVKRLSKLVNDLLNLSKIKSGKMEINIEKFDFSKLVSEVVDGMQLTNSSHKIIYKQKNNILLYADKDRIEQVIQNLISNAIKYSPDAKEVIVDIKKHKDLIIFSVQDFGVGLSEDFKEKVFDRFYRVKSDKNKSISGLGLGLYLCQEIIKLHKGKIWYKSELNKGTTFYVSLPSRINSY